MKRHILNCATISLYLPPMRIGTQCLLVEAASGLLLVDTGLGRQDYQQPGAVIRWMRRFLREFGRPDQTAAHQITRLGYAAEDVRTIVMTHLHLDHAGGLPDFPEAAVHVHELEWQIAMSASPFGRLIYLPQHWAHQPRWQTHDPTNVTDWFGFESIPVFSDEAIHARLVPLPGHTRGHCGVAIGDGTRWILHCGDAVALSALETDPDTVSGRLLGPNLSRLRQLRHDHGHQVALITGHVRLDREMTTTSD